jgi:hypothetical protein
MAVEYIFMQPEKVPPSEEFLAQDSPALMQHETVQEAESIIRQAQTVERTKDRLTRARDYIKGFISDVANPDDSYPLFGSSQVYGELFRDRRNKKNLD